MLRFACLLGSCALWGEGEVMFFKTIMKNKVMFLNICSTCIVNVESRNLQISWNRVTRESEQYSCRKSVYQTRSISWERGEMHGLIGQKGRFSKLLGRFGWNNNIENVHTTNRNSCSHWKTSFTEPISKYIISKFAQFCLCWLGEFTHLVCRFFTS